MICGGNSKVYFGGGSVNMQSIWGDSSAPIVDQSFSFIDNVLNDIMPSPRGVNMS